MERALGTRVGLPLARTDHGIHGGWSVRRLSTAAAARARSRVSARASRASACLLGDGLRGDGLPGEAGAFWSQRGSRSR